MLLAENQIDAELSWTFIDCYEKRCFPGAAYADVMPCEPFCNIRYILERSCRLKTFDNHGSESKSYPNMVPQITECTGETNLEPTESN